MTGSSERTRVDRGSGHRAKRQRPVPTVDEVMRLADAIDPIPGHGHRRRLRRTPTERMPRARPSTRRPRRHAADAPGRTTERLDRPGRLRMGPPKTNAGHRRLALPALVVDELAHHLVEYVLSGSPDALLFTTGVEPPDTNHLALAMGPSPNRFWCRARSMICATSPAPSTPRPAPPSRRPCAGSATPVLLPPSATSTPSMNGTPRSPTPWVSSSADRRTEPSLRADVARTPGHRKPGGRRKPALLVVGMGRFELPTPCSQIVSPPARER